MSTPTRRQAIYLLALVFTSLTVSYLGERLFGLWVDLKPTAIRDWLQGWGTLAPAVFVLLMVLA
ncbi:MAG: hypothetical protein M3506_10485, partial [Chloroflexota bacterium]|nr:hypothetical protein [Chloroflexota bacterium]